MSRQAEYERRDRPLASGVQALVANRLELRRLRAGVVSVKEKARQTCQVRVGKTSVSEPLMKRRNCKLASEPRPLGFVGALVRGSWHTAPFLGLAGQIPRGRALVRDSLASTPLLGP